MQRWTAKKTWIGLGAVCVLLAAYVGLQLLGSVVVADKEGLVVSAAIVAGDGTTQPMYRIPGRLFVAIPRIEGEIEIHCRGGSVRRDGYVTPHMDERAKVERPCRIVVG